MPYIVLPQTERTRTGLEEFAKPFSEQLQQAFAMMMQRQFAAQQRQRNIEQAQQMFPGLLQETPTQFAETAMGQVPVRPTRPQIPKKYQFNLEQAKQYPGLGIDLSTGGMEYKVPSTLGTMPIINITSEGKIEQIGTAPKGAKIVSAAGEPSPAQQKFEAEQTEKKIKLEEKSTFIISQAQDALNTIDEIEKGIGHFGLFGQVPSIPGTERYTWETNINKLLSGKMIELMTQMKEASKTGATGFGQLSEKEGQILREASTALKRGLAPDKAQEYLNAMKTTLQKVIQPIQQPIQQSQGQEDFSQMSDEELRRIASGG